MDLLIEISLQTNNGNPSYPFALLRGAGVVFGGILRLHR